MIWAGIVIFIIIGIFYTRTSIFVEPKCNRRPSEWNIDEIDSLNGFIQVPHVKQKRTKKQSSNAENVSSKKYERERKRSMTNLLKKLMS